MDVPILSEKQPEKVDVISLGTMATNGKTSLSAKDWNNKDGKVIVDHVVFPGVCIYISNRVYPVKDNRSRCQFRIDGADVVTLPI